MMTETQFERFLALLERGVSALERIEEQLDSLIECIGIVTNEETQETTSVFNIWIEGKNDGE